MSIKREGLKKEIVDEYLKGKKSGKGVDFKPKHIKKIKKEADDQIIFNVQREVVDLLQRLFDGEDKNVIYIDGFKIVGYKINNQKLIRVDIYENCK